MKFKFPTTAIITVLAVIAVFGIAITALVFPEIAVTLLFALLILIIPTVVTAFAAFALGDRIKSKLNIRTSLCTVAIALCFGFGIYCTACAIFNYGSSHPIRTVLSDIVSPIAIAVAALIMIIYLYFRSKNYSVAGIIFDFFTGAAFSVSAFMLSSYSHSIISNLLRELEK